MTDNNSDIYSPPVSTDVEGDPADVRETPIPHAPIAGNTSDDDGEAIDQFFEAMAAGPQTYGQDDVEDIPLPITTRLIVRSLPISGTTPLMLLPADPRRTFLRLTTNAHVNAAEEVRIASTSSDCWASSAVRLQVFTRGGFDLSCHTGAVWILGDASSAGQVFTVYAVTS